MTVATRNHTTLRRAFAVALLALPCAFGYITQTVTSAGKVNTLRRSDNAGIAFSLNSQAVANLVVGTQQIFTAASNPGAAAQSALDAWNSIPGANVHFNAMQITATGHNGNDCKNAILIGTSDIDIAAVGGAIAVTIPFYFTSNSPICGGTTVLPAGTIFDSDIIFNPAFNYSTENAPDTIDFQSVLTHELGHSLGSNHSAIVGSTMFWATARNQLNQRVISSDDRAFAATVYPANGATLGTLSGKVTASDGSAVKFSLISAMDRTAGVMIGSITAADGTYSVAVPPGSYIVSAEPFNGFISPENIQMETGSLSSTQVTGGYLPTFLGGSASPTEVAIAGGASATANITVTSGTSSLTTPYYGIGLVGVAGDIKNVFSLGTAISVASGQSIDVGIGAGGVDSTTSFILFGRGISIRPGSIHSDPKGSLEAGQPLMRFTLDIPSQTDTTLATLWIVKGNNILAFSGGLVITPATPLVTAVQDAESARTSFTSGQWVAIYGSNLSGTTRFWNNSDFTGGITTGSPLPTKLDGVSVTIGGKDASVYYVSPVQLNVLSPSNLASGPTQVVVSNNGTVSASFTGTVVDSAPSFFYYPAGGNLYPLAVHLNGKYVGDPAVVPGTEKAHPGETLLMFVNGIAASTGGIIVPVAQFPQAVTVFSGGFSLAATAPFLVSAGEFQVNVTLPVAMPSANYSLTLSVPNGSTSTAGVNVVLPVGPPVP